MDTEKSVEKMFEKFVVEKLKTLENKMHFGSMDRWKNKQCRLAKSLLVLLPVKIELLLLWKECSLRALLLAMTDNFYLEFCGFSGTKAKKSCRSRKILKNASFLAIVAVDTAENEPLKV